jgi:O-methyltransferase involved in polyketide biosynthesis
MDIMSRKLRLSDTAFLVNESRARMADISRDIYARHWVLPESREFVQELWDDFAEKVYPHDALELSIRNRYFLERLQKFVTANDNAIFINIGAGFTSYPFLLEQSIQCIEVDYPNIVALKEKRIKSLQGDGILPSRMVELFAIDLNNTQSQNRLKNFLSAYISGRPSYIQIEGVTYYLKRSRLTSLFQMFKNLQVKGSILAFDFWKPSITYHPIFTKLQRFFINNFDYERRHYNLLNEEFVRSIEGYDVLELSNVTEQECTYAGTSVLEASENILPENYAVLTKR